MVTDFVSALNGVMIRSRPSASGALNSGSRRDFNLRARARMMGWVPLITWGQTLSYSLYHPKVLLKEALQLLNNTLLPGSSAAAAEAGYWRHYLVNIRSCCF